MGSLLRLFGGSGGSGGTYLPTTPQLAFTRGLVPYQALAGNASARTDIQQDNRVRMWAGGGANWSACKAVFTGVLQPTGAVQAAMPNNVDVEFGIEKNTPSSVEQLLFSGVAKGTVVAGAATYLSDAGAATYTSSQLCYARDGFSIPVITSSMPRAEAWTQGGGDFTASSPAVVSQVNATGVMTNPAGGSTALLGASYYGIIGTPDAPVVSVAILGDSIPAGQNDLQVAPSFGGNGFIRRGLDAATVRPAYISFAVSSNRLQFDTPTNGPAKRAMFPYVTHVICALGTNDIGNGRTLQNMKDDATAIAEGVKATLSPYGRRLKVAFCTITPRTTSTDTWITTANQTAFSAAYDNGGQRDQYNAWLKANEGIIFDKVIDINALAADPIEPWKWAVNGVANYATSDGIHPRTAMHILMAVGVTNWANTLTT